MGCCAVSTLVSMASLKQFHQFILSSIVLVTTMKDLLGPAIWNLNVFLSFSRKRIKMLLHARERERVICFANLFVQCRSAIRVREAIGSPGGQSQPVCGWAISRLRVCSAWNSEMSRGCHWIEECSVGPPQGSRRYQIWPPRLLVSTSYAQPIGSKSGKNDFRRNPLTCERGGERKRVEEKRGGEMGSTYHRTGSHREFHISLSLLVFLQILIQRVGHLFYEAQSFL